MRSTNTYVFTYLSDYCHFSIVILCWTALAEVLLLSRMFSSMYICLYVEVSPSGERLAMLLCAVNGDRYVAVLDLHDPSSVRLIADHPRCSAFVVSPMWDRIATYAQSVGELWLWNVEGSPDAVLKFRLSLIHI